MRALILFLLLVPLSTSAQEKEWYCSERTTHEMRKCAFKKLVDSDKNLKQELQSKTFEEWVGIRQSMCEEAYRQSKEVTIYPLMVLKCSVDMNKILLEKTSSFN